MKERFRRIPIELIISPAYEDRTANARLVLLSLIVSARQTPPGVYDGGLKSLEYETALPSKRLKAALSELEHAGMIETVSTGGWWVRDTFRAQCCNRDYSRAAIRHLSERWPDLLHKFTEANHSTLNKFLPQTGDTPPTDPPQIPTGSEAVAVTGTDTGSGSGAGAALKPPPAPGSDIGSGGRGTGEGGVAASRLGGLDAPAAAAPSAEENKDNGARKEFPPIIHSIIDASPPEKHDTIMDLLQAVKAGSVSRQSARDTLKKNSWVQGILVDRLIPQKGSSEDWLT